MVYRVYIRRRDGKGNVLELTTTDPAEALKARDRIYADKTITMAWTLDIDGMLVGDVMHRSPDDAKG